MFVIHYHRESGLIRNWGDDDGSETSFAGPDYAIARFEEWQSIDPATHRVEIASQEIVERSVDEIEDARRVEAANVTEADRAYARYLFDLLKE